MASTFNHPLVSNFEQADDHSKDMHEHRGKTYARHKEMTDFVHAVCEALGGASHFNHDYNVSYIYRPGDTHVLGSIGFGDLRLRKTTKEKNVYYVRTVNINNSKISADHWQHRTVSADKLATAVTLAVKHLEPLDVIDAINMTYPDVSKAISRARDAINGRIRGALTKILGFYVYGGTDLKAPLFKEMRNITFDSAELNFDMDKLYRQVDAAAEFEGHVVKGLTYVAFSDNYGQPVADIVHLETNTGEPTSPPIRVAVTDIPVWMQGRVAVLNMVKPETYVHGVGMRLDDRVFYIAGE